MGFATVYPLVSARAVARACAANPVAVAIPCHRVVRTDGRPGGYRWGLERKAVLLRKERAARAAAHPRGKNFGENCG